jgi:hypothetical protein
MIQITQKWMRLKQILFQKRTLKRKNKNFVSSHSLFALYQMFLSFFDKDCFSLEAQTLVYNLYQKMKETFDKEQRENEKKQNLMRISLIILAIIGILYQMFLSFFDKDCFSLEAQTLVYYIVFSFQSSLLEQILFQKRTLKRKNNIIDKCLSFKRKTIFIKKWKCFSLEAQTLVYYIVFSFQSSLLEQYLLQAHSFLREVDGSEAMKSHVSNQIKDKQEQMAYIQQLERNIVHVLYLVFLYLTP